MEGVDKKVVLIMAPSHSGSTLVDLVLSSGSNFFGLGEFHAIRKARYRERKVAICSLHGFECDFWNEKRWSVVENYLVQNRLKRFLSNIINYNCKAYNYIFRESGKSVLVDSSKYPEWIEDSIYMLNKSNIKPYLIYLNRDPRGVCNSWIRKYPEKSFDEIVIEHKNNINKMNKVYEEASIAKIKIQYENITSSAENSFKDLFHFLNEEYSPEFLNYWKFEHHQIAGNGGTKSLIRKYQGENKMFEGHFNASEYYQNHKLEISKDERWKIELNPRFRQFIEKEFHLNEN